MERRLVNQLCTRTRTHYHRLQALELEPLLLVLKVRSVVPGSTSWDVSAELETREKGKKKLKNKKRTGNQERNLGDGVSTSSVVLIVARQQRWFCHQAVFLGDGEASRENREVPVSNGSGSWRHPSVPPASLMVSSLWMKDQTVGGWRMNS